MKKNFTKFFTLLCLMVLGVSSAWAAAPTTSPKAISGNVTIIVDDIAEYCDAHYTKQAWFQADEDGYLMYYGDSKVSAYSQKTTLPGDATVASHKAFKMKNTKSRYLYFTLANKTKVTVWGNKNSNRRFAFSTSETLTDANTVVSGPQEGYNYETVTLAAGSYFLSSVASNSYSGADLYITAIEFEEASVASTDASLKSVVVNGETVTEVEGVYEVSVPKKDFSVVVTPTDNTATVSYSVDGGAAASTCSFSAAGLTAGQVINIVSTITAEDNTTTTTQNIKVTILAEAMASVSINGTLISDEEFASLMENKSLTVSSLILTKTPVVVASTNAGNTPAVTLEGGAYKFSFDGVDYALIIDENCIVLPQGRVYDLEGKSSANGNLSSDGMTVTYETTNLKYGTFTITHFGTDAKIVQQAAKALNDNKYGLKIGNNNRQYTITNDKDGFVITGISFVGTSNYPTPSVFTLTSSNEDAEIITPTNNVMLQMSGTTPDEVAFVINGGQPKDVYTVTIGTQVITKIVIYYTYAQDVNIGATGWASFAPSAAAMIPSDDANLEAAYYVSEQDGSKATLTEIEKGTAVKAYFGMLIKGTPNSTITFNSVTDAEYTNHNDNLLIGAQADIATSSVSGGTVYVLGCEDEKVGLYQYTGGTLAANKAYLVVSTGAAAAPHFLSFGDDTTGINNAVVEKMQNGVIFNLAGQKVSENYKGIVIINGKKVVK